MLCAQWACGKLLLIDLPLFLLHGEGSQALCGFLMTGSVSQVLIPGEGWKSSALGWATPGEHVAPALGGSQNDTHLTSARDAGTGLLCEFQRLADDGCVQMAAS